MTRGARRYRQAPLHWLPKCNSIRRGRRGRAETEIWFRIRHVALDGGDRASRPRYCDQTIEVTLGPKGAFKEGNLGVLTRTVAAERVVSALPEPRGSPKPAKKPKTPRVVELLQMAIEWQRQLDAGEVDTQAEIARRESITRARVTQVMAMLRLAPEIQEHILCMSDTVRRPAISERALRPIAQIEDWDEQKLRFQDLISRQKGLRLVSSLEWTRQASTNACPGGPGIGG